MCPQIERLYEIFVMVCKYDSLKHRTYALQAVLLHQEFCLLKFVLYALSYNVIEVHKQIFSNNYLLNCTRPPFLTIPNYQKSI